jgi:uncharacterized protein involved in exopolysaccharide biosynthesis
MSETIQVDFSKRASADITLQEMLIPIWARRTKILFFSIAVGLVALAINFLLPVYYKSAASLLPETKKDKLSVLGQFADIAQLAGVGGAGSEIARLYPTIIMSETILRNVILSKYRTVKFRDSVNLIEYYGYSEETPEENVAKMLRKMNTLLTATLASKTSVVDLSVEMPEPQLAADVLNTIVYELDQFMRSKRTTSASEQVKWIDIRIKEIEDQLRVSEDDLKAFRERNRQVTNSPQLMLEQERLIRVVQVKSTIFVELKKQYELAKLEEIKNISIVNVLEPGRAPVKKERPHRLLNTLILFLFSLIASATYFLIEALYGSRISSFIHLIHQKT